MILYRGKLYDNSRQSELIASLRDDLYAPLRCGGTLSPQTVINACDRLMRRVLDGEFDSVIKPFLNAFNVSEAQFNDMTALFSKEGLEYKCAVELCDGEKVIDGRIIRKRYPLGALLHIAAGNVDALPAYSVIEGLLSGNINVLKLPMGDSGLSVLLLYELIKEEPALSDYIYVFDVPSTETATLKALADLCDGVVVWGGDAAVKAARTMADVDTKIIAWGHKLSFAYAEPDASDAELYALAKSICDTNQLLCSSCQGIFVDTDSKETQRAFARRFFEILKAANENSRPADYGMRAKNAINLYNERLERHATGSEILKEGAVSVIIAEDETLSLSYLYRNVWVKRLPRERLYTLKKYKGCLQTAAVLTRDRETREEIARTLALIGVVRITSGGNMSRTVRGEAHDGTYALREYSRIVETELFPPSKSS
ncbi:MAG: acyl-CoA reductase [Clostridia bacterium]|nr:acyl-CoA reductase [Clostridia bacterium]